MTTYTFNIKEFTENGKIIWKASDESNDKEFQINVAGYFTSGEFPEISSYLKKNYHVDHEITYKSTAPFKDHFDQATQKWTFNRSGDIIIVNDIPRVIYRITIQSE
jgi:uncharacterized protein (DUF924 family)